jgi:hypothetical protein
MRLVVLGGCAAVLLIGMTMREGCVASAKAHEQCIQFDDLSWAFDVSTTVFIGTVVSNTPTGIKGFHVNSDIGTFRVERIWKGAVESETTIRADAPFTIGARYIVFASGKPLGNSVECNWAEVEAKADKKREWLATKPSEPPK